MMIGQEAMEHQDWLEAWVQLVLCMVQCLQRKLLMRVGCMEM